MDIIKEKKQSESAYLNKRVLGIVSIVLFLVFLIFIVNSSNDIELDSLKIGNVKKGDINASVDGYGKLVSAKTIHITLDSDATVEEVFYKRGGVVRKGDLIVRLQNPELKEQVLNAQITYENGVTSTNVLRLGQEQKLLDLERELIGLESEYQAAELRLNAMKQLSEKGVISKLEYEEKVLDTSRRSDQVSLFKKGLERLKLINQDELNLQKTKVERDESTYQTIKARHEELDVTASMAGIIQSLDIEIGQRIQAGTKIASIASANELLAQIGVPQNSVNRVTLGAIAIVDTRIEEIQSEVVRVDSVVEDGLVLVELKFTEEPKTTVRPEQTVDGEVFVSQIKDAVYVELPQGAIISSTNFLFKFNEDLTEAKRVEVSIGQQANNYVEVLNGLSVGDQIIISDTSNFEGADLINIK